MREGRDPMIGSVLSGRFEITEYITAGGMGSIYKATQRPLERDVAIKLMDYEGQRTEEFQRRFYLEASLCARLSHPNIVRIFDYGCHEDRVYFIAMELLKGETLRQISDRAGPIEPRRAISFLKQVSSALIEAHGADLVHRDLKPSNLFVVTDGMGQEHVKILDFGVVKQVSSAVDVTQAGATLGSPLYMSPEQIQGPTVDARSDIYALGVILYQLLVGRPPFTGREPYQVLVQHLSAPPEPFAKANPKVAVPEALEALTMRALAKDPDDRFESARALATALVEIDQALADLEPVTSRAREAQRSADAQAQHDMLPTQTINVASPEGLANMGADDILALVRGGLPEEEDDGAHHQEDLNTASIAELRSLVTDGYVAYVDFSCPYCFALHERVTRWGLDSKITWCMIEHSSHVLDGPFDLDQEQMLSTEVVEVHHRAPDVELLLPDQRCRSTTATRLQTYVQRELAGKQHVFRTAVFRALWQDGRDIGDPEVLARILVEHDISSMFLEFCEEEPPELSEWQHSWETGDFDRSIPVLTHPETGRILIGLSDERILKEFLLGARSRVLDSAVCYYQQRPTILLWGWMSRVWKVLSEVRSCCEVLQAPTADEVRRQLSEIRVPDLLIIEASQVEPDGLEAMARLARSRSVPWVIATSEPSAEEEVHALSLGAVEYLPATGDGQVARARLGRILRDRYNLERVNQDMLTDPLTKLPSRHSLLEHLRTEWERGLRTQEPISFLLLDLDGFKPFNKAHGYLTGNAALIKVGAALQAAVNGPGTMVSRFGGNEFGVLLPGTSRGDAQRTADDMRTAVAGLGLESPTSVRGHLTASVGAHTLRPSVNASLFELVDRASINLKTSRGRG
jgi:diguanylate cyclase (GGDEF)-like protein